MTPVSTTPRPPTGETAEPVALPLGVRFDTYRAEPADDVSLLAVINVLLRQRALILLLPIALGAIAASIALPPRSRISAPALAASGWLAATIPSVVVTIDRPGTGSGFARDSCAPLMPLGSAVRNAQSAKRRRR